MKIISLLAMAILLFSFQATVHSQSKKNNSKPQLFIIHLDEKKSKDLLKNKTLENEIRRIETQFQIEIKPAFHGDLVKIKKHIQKIEQTRQKKLLNPYLFFTTVIDNTNQAYELTDYFRNYNLVENFYPYPELSLSQIGNIPDLSPSQNYIQESQTELAWQDDLFGQNIKIVNFEFDFLPEHEDLQLNQNNFLDNSICQFQAHPSCKTWKAHGTAVAGIIKGLHNNHGINGISPQSNFYLSTISDTLFGSIMPLIDGIGNNDMEASSIFMIQVQVPGVNLASCNDNPIGCLPASVTPIDFRVIELASALGITVIQTGGNGSINLDDPNNYLPHHQNLIQNNSSAITVAASHNNQKIDFSNCGSIIDVHAPGLNLTTTNYPFLNSNLVWNPIEEIENFNNENIHTSYTNNFSGTSASTAVTAGLVALLQTRFQAIIGLKSSLSPETIKTIIRTEANENEPCPIGTRANLEDFFTNLDNYLHQLRNDFNFFEALENGQPISENNHHQLQELGIHLICNEDDHEMNHPSCPVDPNENNAEDPAVNQENRDDQEEDYDPDLLEGFEDHGRGKYMDITGNGRADLIIFDGNKMKVYEYLDGFPEEPRYIFRLPIYIDANFRESSPHFFWPMIEDINNDRRADLIVFDKLNGIFYIKYTEDDMFAGLVWSLLEDENIELDVVDELNNENGDNEVNDNADFGWPAFHWQRTEQYYNAQNSDELWDLVVQTPWNDTFPSNLKYANYSRPILADYNQDGWVDIGLLDSEGNWNIKWNRLGRFLSFNTWDEQHEYMPPNVLERVPSYAFLPIVIDKRDRSPITMGLKIPNILTSRDNRIPDFGSGNDDAFSTRFRGRIKLWTLENSGNNTFRLSEPTLSQRVGFNDHIMLTLHRTIHEREDNNRRIQSDIILRNMGSSWQILRNTENYNHDFEYLESTRNLCESACFPFTADFDGDLIDDIAVLHSNGVKVLFSNSEIEELNIASDRLNGNLSPPYFFFGGASFPEAKANACFSNRYYEHRRLEDDEDQNAYIAHRNVNHDNLHYREVFARICNQDNNFCSFSLNGSNLILFDLLPKL